MSERTMRWIKLYDEGKTLREIADEYGVTKQRVQQVLKKHIKLRDRTYWQSVPDAKGRRWKHDHDAIRQDRRDGMSQSEIMEKHGCSASTVYIAIRADKP